MTARRMGGVLPILRYRREVYFQHASGGEQTRTLTVTWLRWSVAVELTSSWKAGR